MADLIPIFKKELKEECETTRKMLNRVPGDKFDWKPHPKSMSLKVLSNHIAELPEWIAMALTTEGLDFAKNQYQPKNAENNKELMQVFEKYFTIGDSQLRPEFESHLNEPWILRSGDFIIRNYTRGEVIRMALNQITHHRAQLGVYLRLLDIPIPGSYGPSADEH